MNIIKYTIKSLSSRRFKGKKRKQYQNQDLEREMSEFIYVMKMKKAY